MKDCSKVEQLCKELGIRLEGKDGQPFHCGERMETKAGVIGVDYAHCRKCGLAIGDLRSPHINGGWILSEAGYEDQETWVQLSGESNK